MLSSTNIISDISANWASVAGNTLEYEYYTGTETDNPSGNKNIKNILHKQNDMTIFTLHFVWDSDDDVIKIQNS